MRKIRIIKFDENKYDINEMMSTKYDNLFRNVIKERGKSYYRLKKVEKFFKSKNKISAIVKGSRDYHVSVEYINDSNINVSCDCEYHKTTDVYCKHVYALILTLKLMYEKNSLLKVYNKNKKRIFEINDMIRVLLCDNKEYLHAISHAFALNIKKEFENKMKEIDEFISDKDFFKIRSGVKYSYEYLERISERYNDLLDEIEEGKKELEKRKNEPVDSFEVTLCSPGDGLEQALDNIIAEVPLEILQAVRAEDIKNGESTEIMDKAIKERKRRDEQIALEIKLKQLKQQEQQLLMMNTALYGLLGGMFFSSKNRKSNNNQNNDLDYLMPWEESLVKTGEYEPYHFEEENMDEDDFYFEDD